MRSGWWRGSIYWVLLVSGWFSISKTIIPDAQEHFLTHSTRRDTHLFGGFGLTEPEDGQSGRIGFALRGPTYEIPRVTQKNVDDWIQCMLGIAVLMKRCLGGMIEVRRNWRSHGG